MLRIILLIVLSISTAGASTIELGEYRREIKEMALNGHTPLMDYKTSRQLIFKKIDIREDSEGFFVKDVYCNIIIRIDQNARRVKSSVLNIEHTWPRSRFNDAESFNMQKSDLHHLFATESKANNNRGSNLFGELSHAEAASHRCSASRKGILLGSTKDGFAPQKSHRGNVARALFYFAIRYNLRIKDIEEVTLRKWNLEDPVDENEMQRNDRVMQIQGNRNPFIDSPWIVDLIDNI